MEARLFDLCTKYTGNLLACVFLAGSCGGWVAHIILDLPYDTKLFLQVQEKCSICMQPSPDVFLRTSIKNGRCSRMLWLSWSGHSLGMLTNNTLDFSAVEPRMQPSRKPTSPWSFYYFFLWWIVKCYIYIFYILLLHTNHKLLPLKEMLFRRRLRCRIVLHVASTGG